MSSLGRILNKSRARAKFSPDDRWVLPTDFIGVEFEYEGVTTKELPDHPYADLFKYHEETSLRDEGAEYVFAEPLFGVDSMNAINWITEYAVKNKWKCSKRTGIHVHLDVRDLEPQQLAGMAMIYSAVEPILYKWIGDGRESSHFCLPLYSADDALVRTCKILRSAIRDSNTGGVNTVAHSEGFPRYCGFNLNALYKFGSIEFRPLQTTHDTKRILDWINMTMSVKAAAFKLPTSDRAVITMMERMGVKELLDYVFPAPLAEQLYKQGVSEDLFKEIGLSSARDIAVHGCTDNVWVAPKFPKGVNVAFQSWVKSNKKQTADESNEFTIVHGQAANIPNWRGLTIFDEAGVAAPPPPQQAPVRRPLPAPRRR